MNFNEVLDQVIIMAGNNLKTFQQNASTVGSKNTGISQNDKDEAVTALKDSSEKNALEDYLQNLPENYLKNIYLIAMLGKESGEDFEQIKESAANKDSKWYLSQSIKHSQYLYSGKTKFEELNINLIDL